MNFLATDKLGEIIRQYRKTMGLTQKQLAEKLQKAESTVRMWELGKNTPALETLKDIGDVLDIPLGELMIEAGYINEFKEMFKENLRRQRRIPTFGEAIKMARNQEHVDLSLVQLSKKTNIPESVLEEIENGINVNLSSLQITEIANALDVTFAYLYLLKHIGNFIQRVGVLSYRDVVAVSSMTYQEYLEAFGPTDMTELDLDREKELHDEFVFVKNVDDMFRLYTMSPNIFDLDNISKLGFMTPSLNGRKLSKNDIQKILSKIDEMKDEFEYQD